MRFDPPLIPATLVRRYQRFLADVRLTDGRTVTVHCPNSGAMTGCLGEGWPARLSSSDNPRRRHAHTLEMVHNGRCWIGVHSARANRLAEEAVHGGMVSELAGATEVRREQRLGERSRIDLVVTRADGTCYVEVKSVTLVDDRGRYAFPDAVTDRGRRHLDDLTEHAAGGGRAAMLYVIQRSDGAGFTTADAVDPEYGAALRRAAAAGVKVMAYRAEVSPEGIEIVAPEAVVLERG